MQTEQKILVKDLAYPTPKKVLMSDPLSKVSDKMLRAKIHSVIIVNEAVEPIGIISSWDLVKISFFGEKAKDIPVSKLLKEQKLITIRSDRPWTEAFDLMLDYHIRSLPVVNKAGKLDGIVTLFDLAKFARKQI